MMWRNDPAVEATRKLPGWVEFHRLCAAEGVFFDHAVQRDGRRGAYFLHAFTVERRPSYFNYIPLAEGRGKTPLDAVLDSYAKCGRVVGGVKPLIAMMRGEPETDFSDLLGGDEPPIDFEDLLG